jgi:glycosyltransferase involved in cell wall biosynthesis
MDISSIKMNKNVQNTNSRLTIVIPVYNEALIIKTVIRDIYEKVIKKIPGTKFIVAEDGSVDGTKEILHKLNEEIPFDLISSEERKGYTAAFIDVLGIPKTELIFFSDSDGQHDPADIFKLLKEIDKNDIVSGYKMPRHDPRHRVIISKMYNFLLFILFWLKMKDIDSGFKLIKRKVIEDILKDGLSFKYCVMSEFILKAHLKGYKIKEIPVTHYPRKYGTTGIFRPNKLPSIIFGLLKDIIKIKLTYQKI